MIALFQQDRGLRHPTIAMVHGAAYAGGCELALHCDPRVAADLARRDAAGQIGLVVPFARSCQKLVEIIGPAFTRADSPHGPAGGRQARVARWVWCTRSFPPPSSSRPPTIWRARSPATRRSRSRE